jgi:hypothetical protein
MPTTNVRHHMTQPQIMPVSQVVEVRKNASGLPTIVIDGWDIGNWVLAEPITVDTRNDGMSFVAIRLVARDLRLNGELVSSTTKTIHPT